MLLDRLSDDDLAVLIILVSAVLIVLSMTGVIHLDISDAGR